MQAFTTCKSEIRRGENTSLELSGSQAASKTDCLSSHLVPALNSSDFIAYRFWRHGAAPSEIRVTVASNSALWQVCCESTNQSIDRSNLVVIMLLYRSAYCPAWSDLFYQSSLALSLMIVGVSLNKFISRWDFVLALNHARIIHWRSFSIIIQSYV